MTTAEPDVRDAAIDALRERLQRGLYYYLSHERSDLARYTSEELTQMAQDFAQDAVLRVLDNLQTFRGDSQFVTWAMKIAARIAVSELRRARYRDFSLEDLTSPEGEQILNLEAFTSTQLPAPERSTERQDFIRILNRAFNEILTERQRIALEAVTLRGIPMDTVAEQMGTNRNALYKLLHDARKKLKTYLEEQEGLSMDYVMGLFAR
jgi:RNA polymerase sigma-70 factor (ECF subfamily)